MAASDMESFDGVDDDEEMTDAASLPPSSLSQHLFEMLQSLGRAEIPADKKLETCNLLLPFLKEPDAHLDLNSKSVGYLPVFDWNGRFRKSYSLLFWVRPVMCQKKGCSCGKNDKKDEDSTPEERRRILYRFGTSPEDANGLGVCATLGEWSLVKQPAYDNAGMKKKNLLQTTVTAFSLPHQAISHAAVGAANEPTTTPIQHVSYVSCPLILPEGEWSLVGINHVFPYLKRPQWSLVVNGSVAGSGELSYPVLDSVNMSHNSLLQNIAYGGATVIESEALGDATSIPASQMQQSQSQQRLNLHMQLCSVCMYPEAIEPELQSILSDAGPFLSLQQEGRIVGLVPPVSNWSKGTGLDGPHVGIPLMHSLDIQKLASKAVYSYSAAALLILRNPHRIVLPSSQLMGETESTPKVGLMEPTSASVQDAPLVFEGRAIAVHTLAEFLLQTDVLIRHDPPHDPQFFSLLLYEQNALSAVCIPFFLALVPTGHEFGLQHVLYENSFRHLHALYSKNGEYASVLILMLATAIQYGGARVHEEVLQSGLLHTLTTTLRRSLQRANLLGLFDDETRKDESVEEFCKKCENVREEPYNDNAWPCPRVIPRSIAHACAQLVHACCGPACLKMELLSPAQQTRRYSDLALTAVFGMALDLDLWGSDIEAASVLLKSTADRYGGPCVPYGIILRNQVPVQFLLDSIKLRFDSTSNAVTASSPEQLEALQSVGQSLSQVLFSMLLASLNNRKVISQAEHDVTACMGALTDTSLGTMSGHVVLQALCCLLRWCDILPEPRKSATTTSLLDTQDEVNSTSKTQVASRLGRNLLMGQYHDVIAPMLLSRTISSSKDWKRDWRLALVVFSWLASISGAEGQAAAKSTGKLLLASALAGSLQGCLLQPFSSNNTRLVSCLFLPPPVMALSIIGASSNSKRDKGSWSYSDLLSDRLRVMMPLLPGLVVSLFPSSQEQQQQQSMDAASLSVLTELIAAVGGAFHRVYGGLNQVPRKSSFRRRTRRSTLSTKAVKAAKDYAPHLLVVAILLEHAIEAKRPKEEGDEDIEILSSCAPPDTGKLSRTRTDSETEWIDVNSTLSDSANSYSVAYKAERRGSASSAERRNSSADTSDATLAKLSSCQSIVLNCLTDLIANAMKHGGGEASTEVWRSVISTLNDSLSYSKRVDKKEIEADGDDDASKKQIAQNMLCRLAALVLTKVVTRENDAEIMWSVDLCSAVSRLCDLAEEKELLRTPIGKKTEVTGPPPYSRDQVLLHCAFLDILSFGREVTGWCQLVLHPTPQKQEGLKSSDNLGSRGEEILPALSPMKEQMAELVDGSIVQPGFDLYQRVTDDGSVSSTPNTPGTPRRTLLGQQDLTPGAASKLLLPILQPSLRVVLGCFGSIRSSTMISVPQPAASAEADAEKPHTVKMSLLSYTANELRHTLTAAIVGLSFPSARDVALNTLASLRRSMTYHRNAQDEDAVKVTCFLFIAISEEIRVRYDGERRLRDKALFDAYEDDQISGNDKDDTKEEGEDEKSKEEAESSRAVERLILGGDLIPSKSASTTDSPKTKTETVSFDHGIDSQEEAPSTPSTTRRRVGGGGSEDFVMFHETYASPDDVVGKDGGIRKMGWSHYKGLGLALENCSELAKSKASEGHEPQVESMLTVLTSYLDTWDDNVARDAAESELVELFNDSITITETSENGPPPLPLSPLGSKVQAVLNSSAPALPIIGTETAADAMTNFIEFSSVEKSRLMEVESTFLPSRRSSCVSFAERFCWAQYMEFTKDDTRESMNVLWERSTADGNRDVRSRLISMPCNPQFKRFIPAWLDHGASVSALPGEGESPAQVGEEEGDAERANSLLSRGDDIDLSVAKKLVEAGDLEIVDITKKEIEEDEENDDILLDAAVGDLDEVDVSERPTPYSEFPDVDQSESGDVGPSSDYDGSPETKQADKEEPNSDVAADSAVATEETKEKEATIEDLIETTVSRSYHHHITSSPYSHPPDNSSATLSLIHSSAASMIEFHFDNCLHVKTEGSRKCAMLLTATHLILEFDAESAGLYDGEMMAVREEAERQKMIEETRGGNGGEVETATEEELEKRHRDTAALRPKCIRFNISELSHVYLRRYRLRDSALEMFFIPSGGSSFGGFGLYAPATSLFLDFGPGYEGNIRRDDAANAIMRRAPPQTIKQWPDRSGQFLHEQLSRLAMGWVEGRITNFDYLLHLNILSGRSYNDLCQYPVMPWVLSNFYSKDIPDLSDRTNFRDLSKPMGALNPDRLEDFIDRFETFADPTIPPFMYGSHYSTSAGVVLHFLVRMHPFAGLHRQLQGGHFDVADRLFSSVPRTWDMCTGSSAAEVKELTPEWYCNPSFLKNTNQFKFGSSQEGEVIGDVILPPWADGSPEKFVEVMRDALESDICSDMLPDWIDLIFGRKQQGPEAIKAHNVFFYLTYYGSVDVASIEDESLRTATELQIAHFGQCPMQLFRRPHVRRVQRWRNFRRLTFYQLLSAYTHGAGPSSGGSETSEEDIELKTPMLRKDGQQRIIGEPVFLPFFSAPISHWVHLAAPPPGPHADLIAVRLAGLDRCLAVDAHGIFHSFRWAWKPEDVPTGENGDENEEEYKPLDNQQSGLIDKGGFVAQRELPRFRTVPRLPHIPNKRSGDGRATLPAVGISKTLFAGRSVLLVLSDGDGRGALAMQLVDPAKGTVRGEAIVPSVHSSRITCIAMDPIGTAAGHGGVGGELAILGSADGGASIWRFMSSHYLPLRPRVRMRGHGGAKVHAVALSSSIHVCATVSENRCCVFSVGNGGMIRSFSPPQDTLDGAFFSDENTTLRTVFADTPALCLSVQGFLVCVCNTMVSNSLSPSANRSIITLHLFSLEGVSLGSKALESWRGIPHKISATPDGTAIFVCSGRGITIHRLSAVTPLEFIDEWHITENEELDEHVPTAWDVDFGPSILRPVVGAAACSSGALRLHALPGITHWSERHKKSSVTAAVGNALAKPAQRIKQAMGKGLGLGSKFVGVGKDIGKEVQTDVKERGVGGFLGGMIFRKGGK